MNRDKMHYLLQLKEIKFLLWFGCICKGCPILNKMRKVVLHYIGLLIMVVSLLFNFC